MDTLTYTYFMKIDKNALQVGITGSTFYVHK